MNTKSNFYDMMRIMIVAPLMLQAFAENGTGTNRYENIITTASGKQEGDPSDIQAGVQTYYSRAFLRPFTNTLVIDQFLDEMPIPENRGTTMAMKIPNRIPIPTTALTEGVTPNGGSFKIDEKTIETAQYGYWLAITDVVNDTNPNPVMTLAVQGMGDQASTFREVYLRNKILETTAKSYAPKSDGTVVNSKAGGSGKTGLDQTCAVTINVLRSLRSKLRAAKVPAFDDGLYPLLMHTYTIEQLKKDTLFEKLIVATESGASKLYKGEIGVLEGFRIIESELMKIERATLADSAEHAVFHSIALGKGCAKKTGIGNKGTEVIVKPTGSGDDPLNQRATGGWKCYIGAGVAQTEGVVDLMSCNADYDSAPAN